MNNEDQGRLNRESGEQGANAARGYGDGGDTPFGQIAEGSSNRAEGGYGGDNAGGFGQQVMNSQWGQGGSGPMTQGAGYGQGGGQFGPAGRDSQSAQTPYSAHPAGANPDRGGSAPRAGGATYGQPDYSPAGQRSDFRTDQRYSGPVAPHHDEHEHHYRNWRETQLSAHDRDYARWRDEQARKYDEDYHGWRSERHSAFSREFEGWRANRGGQASGQPASSPASGVAEQDRPAAPNAAHGANPTLANIADGHAGAHGHAHEAHRSDAEREQADRIK